VSDRAVDVAIPFGGGISAAAKETAELDGDRVRPAFTRELHREPGGDDA
jgi:hypothetical protein